MSLIHHKKIYMNNNILNIHNNNNNNSSGGSGNNNSNPRDEDHNDRSSPPGMTKLDDVYMIKQQQQQQQQDKQLQQQHRARSSPPPPAQHHSSSRDRHSPDSSSSSTPLFPCPSCPQVYTAEQSLKQHILSVHHGRQAPDSSPQLGPRCPLCQKVVRDLPSHIALLHSGAPAAGSPHALPPRPQSNLEILTVQSQNHPSAGGVLNLATPKVERIDPDDERLFLPHHPSAPVMDSPALTVIKRCIEEREEQQQQQPESKGHLPMNLSVRKNPLGLHHGPTSVTQSSAQRFENSGEICPEEIAKARALYQARIAGVNHHQLLSQHHHHQQQQQQKHEHHSLQQQQQQQHPHMHNLSQDSGNHSDGESGHSSMGSSNDSGTGVNGGAGGGSGGGGVSRKRRKQTHVPEQNKDDRYWARRLKNNEAAKRSRDMRIKREKVVFEENSRLEKLNQDLQTDMERMATENKELHLKLDIIMEENMRIKSVLLGYQSQRRSSVEVSSGGGHSSSDEDNNHASPPHQQLHHLSNSNRGGGRRESSEVRPFPFPN